MLGVGGGEMAADIEAYRRAAAENAARALGQDVRQNRTTTLGVRVQGHEGEIGALPEHSDGCEPVQDLDPDSPTFGLFWFLPGYDTPGDPNHPVR